MTRLHWHKDGQGYYLRDAAGNNYSGFNIERCTGFIWKKVIPQLPTTSIEIKYNDTKTGMADMKECVEELLEGL